MDAYSDYNQIPMHLVDKIDTSFTTNKGLYCYEAIAFGLNNVRITYQRFINTMFTNLIGKTMKVYVITC